MPDEKKKRILSIDGGGIRCMIAVEVLSRIETQLQQEHNTSAFRLRDHFDLIAGTSGGAILACGIALGYSLAEIRTFVSDNAKNLFKPAPLHKRYRSVFNEALLEKNIQRWFGIDTKLGSDQVKSTLLLPMHNMTTDSRWFVSNNPMAKFNEFGIANRYTQLFSDGAMTGFMNPAFKAFQYATTSTYGLNWATGEQAIHILSMGSGYAQQKRPNLKIDQTNVINSVLGMPDTMIQSSIREQDILCRTFGRCIYGNNIDSELGDMLTINTALKDRLFTYSRISPDISVEGLSKLGLGHISASDVFKIDCVDSVDKLLEIGAAQAQKIESCAYN